MTNSEKLELNVRNIGSTREVTYPLKNSLGRKELRHGGRQRTMIGRLLHKQWWDSNFKFIRKTPDVP
jgi:hypothetical protein